MATHSSWARHNFSSLPLPPWQGSLAVPEMGTDSCEVSSAKARSINPLLITCLTLEGTRRILWALLSRGSSPPWRLCWAGFSADGGGKGSELGFLTGCILHVPLPQSCSLCCWPTENAAFSICVGVEQDQVRGSKWADPSHRSLSLKPSAMLSKQNSSLVWCPGLKCLHAVSLLAPLVGSVPTAAGIEAG